MARLWTTLYLKQYSMSVTDKHIELHRLGLFLDFHLSSISYLGDNLLIIPQYKNMLTVIVT